MITELVLEWNYNDALLICCEYCLSIFIFIILHYLPGQYFSIHNESQMIHQFWPHQELSLIHGNWKFIKFWQKHYFKEKRLKEFKWKNEAHEELAYENANSFPSQKQLRAPKLEETVHKTVALSWHGSVVVWLFTSNPLIKLIVI